MSDGSASPARHHPNAPSEGEGTKPKRRRRKWRWVLVGLLITFVAIALTFSSFMSRIIASKLKSAVESRLRATFEFDSLDYTFPYSVEIRNVRFIGQKSNDRTTLLTIDQLDLTLARIPWPKSPVVIKNLDLKGPSVHIVRDKAGEIVQVETIERPKQIEPAEQKPDVAPTPQPPPSPSPPPQHKLSEMFELRRFTISGGEIVYEDHATPGAVPLVFRNINSDLGVTPVSRAIYAYKLTTRQEPLVSISASGMMDIDALRLDLERFDLRLEAKPSTADSPLPPSVQRAMNQMQMAGALTARGKAMLPLRAMKDAEFSVDADLTDGRAILPRNRATVDELSAHVHADRKDGLTQILLPHFIARSGIAVLRLDPMVTRMAAGGWTIEKFSGSLIATPSESTTLPVRIVGIPLSSGTLEFTGQASRAPGSPVTFSANVSVRDSVVTFPSWPSPIRALNGELVVSPKSVQITTAEADMLDGHVTGDGEVGLAKPFTYQGRLSAKSVELSQVTSLPKVMPNRKFSVAGKSDADVRFNGVIPRDGTRPSEYLIVQGTADVDKGEIWDLPILNGVVSQMGIAREGLKLSDVAARFEFRKRVVTLQRAALNSELLGLQGHGTVDLDGEINLDIIAAPLGDWRKQIERTKIPIVSNVVGGVAGAVQTMLNSATSTLLYQFQVRGKLAEPQIKPVAAPILTDTTAVMFAKMLQQPTEAELLQMVNEEEKE